MAHLKEMIDLVMISFIGAAATYYSAEYSMALNLTMLDIEYWFPLIAALITMYYAIEISIRALKKIFKDGYWVSKTNRKL